MEFIKNIMEETKESMEEKLEKCSQNEKRISKGMIGGALLGASIVVGAIGFGEFNTLIKNPYKENQMVQNYIQMGETKAQLYTHRRELMNEKKDFSPYVPESAKKEFSLVYGSKNLKQRVDALDSYMEKVEGDMAQARGNMEVKKYQKWNKEHFTTENTSPWIMGGLLLESASLAGIPLLCWNRKRRDKLNKQFKKELSHLPIAI